MEITSSHWRKSPQHCTLHNSSVIPCPVCLREQHPSVKLMLTEMEFASATEFDINRPDGEEHTGMGMFVPQGFPWLLQRVHHATTGDRVYMG